jgi:hypothetical protein
VRLVVPSPRSADPTATVGEPQLAAVSIVVVRRAT